MMYHYTMCGLDYVFLRSGFRVRQTDYGSGVSIKNAEALDWAIAAIIITSPPRIRGQEVRFLRSLLHYSQNALANELGVKRITVARWEGVPNTPIPGTADRALRTVAANRLFHDLEALRDVAVIFPEIADQRTEQLIMSYLPDEKPSEPSLFPEIAVPEDKWKASANVA